MTYANLTNKIETFTQTRYVWTLFIFTAFLIFSPFFLKFHVIISTTDSVFNHFPNILYGYRALHSGNFGMWNPYIFAGTDFTTSMHDHMLNPFNWPLLLFPEKYLFQALTLKVFIEYVLIGVFAFKIFQIYCDRTSALFLGLIAQLCTFTWFTTETFIATDLFFFSIISIYLILSAEKRRYITNFIFMSIASFGIFIVGHVGYIAAFTFPVLAVFLVKYWKQLRTPWRGIPLIFIIAMLVGLAMAAFRLVPITLALFNDQAVQHLWPTSLNGNNGYFTLTGFIPEIFGEYYPESLAIFHNLGVDGRHIQFHNLLYFGIAPLFLIFLAALGSFGKHARLVALLGLAVALSHMFLIQPLSDIINFMMMPFIHDIIPRVGYPFLFLAALLLIIKNISHTEFKISSTNFRALIILVGFVIGAAITVWIKAIAPQAGSINHWQLILISLRLILIANIVGVICLAWFLKINDTTIKKLTDLILTCAILGILLPLFIFIAIFSIKHQWPHEVSLRTFIYAIGITLWALAITSILRKLYSSQKSQEPISNFVIGIFLICFFILILPLDPEPNTTVNSKTLFNAYFSLINFIILAAISWEIFMAFTEKKLGFLQFIIILMLFILGDLLFNTKLSSYSGAPSFASTNYLYPPSKNAKLIASLDLKQYRVNHPGLLSENSWGDQIYANIPMTYDISTYGGIDSVVNYQLQTLLTSFQTPENAWLGSGGIVPMLTQPRLLDLLGVKYDFNSSGKLMVRPNALARLSVFTSFKVVPTAKLQIQLLKKPNFNLTKTVLINQNPQWHAPKNSQKFRALDFTSTNSSVINANLNLKKPAIILFDDSYSPNWQATWNGKTIPIFLADGNFMAVNLPAGSGKLSFEFQPILFLRLAKLSWALATILLLASLYAALTAFYPLPKKRSNLLENANI